MKKLKWALLPLLAVALFISLTSFVDSSEGGGGGQVIVVHLSTQNQIINCAEQKESDSETVSYRVSGGGTITVNGQVVSVNATAGSIVQASYKTFICSKCFWGCTWCASCNSIDDIMVITIF